MVVRVRRGRRVRWCSGLDSASGAWRGSLRRGRRSRRSWRNCAMRRRDGCSLNGFWVAPRWTKMVGSESYPRSLSHNRPLPVKRQHRKSRRWTRRHRLFALARPRNLHRPIYLRQRRHPLSIYQHQSPFYTSLRLDLRSDLQRF